MIVQSPRPAQLIAVTAQYWNVDAWNNKDFFVPFLSTLSNSGCRLEVAARRIAIHLGIYSDHGFLKCELLLRQPATLPDRFPLHLVLLRRWTKPNPD